MATVASIIINAWEHPYRIFFNLTKLAWICVVNRIRMRAVMSRNGDVFLGDCDLFTLLPFLSRIFWKDSSGTDTRVFHHTQTELTCPFGNYWELAPSFWVYCICLCKKCQFKTKILSINKKKKKKRFRISFLRIHLPKRTSVCTSHLPFTWAFSVMSLFISFLISIWVVSFKLSFQAARAPCLCANFIPRRHHTREKQKIYNKFEKKI